MYLRSPYQPRRLFLSPSSGRVTTLLGNFGLPTTRPDPTSTKRPGELNELCPPTKPEDPQQPSPWFQSSNLKGGSREHLHIRFVGRRRSVSSMDRERRRPTSNEKIWFCRRECHHWRSCGRCCLWCSHRLCTLRNSAKNGGHCGSHHRRFVGRLLGSRLRILRRNHRRHNQTHPGISQVEVAFPSP